VVKSTQDREGENLASVVIRRNRLTILFWDLLCDALMWSGLIEVLHRGMKDTMQLLLLEDEKMIEALSTHAAQKAFTDGIRSRGVIGCFEELDGACGCHSGETRSEFAIVVVNEICGACPYAVASRSCCATHVSVGECCAGYVRRVTHDEIADAIG
jgi:hypothetical protein